MIRNKRSTNGNLLIFIAAALLLTFFCQNAVFAQDKNTPVSDTYISGVFLENQTCIIPDPGTTEMVINHRFGPFNSGHELAWGIYSSTNIRFALNHVFKTKLPVLKNTQFGIGSTRTPMTMEGSAKWSIFKQTTNNKIPVSLTWYGAMYYDARTTDKIGNPNHTFYEEHRLSYFTELLISKSFGGIFNLQLAPTYSHYNLVAIQNPIVQQDSTGAVPDGIPVRKNGNFGLSVLGRLKLTSTMALMLEYDKNFTKLLVDTTATLKNPTPVIALGIEFSTSAAHSFQLFVTTANAISYQRNMVFNNGLLMKDGNRKSALMLGFNITRVFY